MFPNPVFQAATPTPTIRPISPEAPKTHPTLATAATGVQNVPALFTTGGDASTNTPNVDSRKSQGEAHASSIKLQDLFADTELTRTFQSEFAEAQTNIFSETETQTLTPMKICSGRT
ncbi:hypothetical protein [Glaciimonas immobilis]|uniref:Uncharacterized protein n=1 Tax=Glaciimonas immobilis TaxID=728004 RepID=A0A840RQT0_9BURK|nr:hypothetical protein [Glaciimonas immobilis]KAF3997980.1 hypothetical protein HAV38_10465 [Glaciimonas immobilis]MBB5199346.1 hypothetical protein [Glaciimonas immobilis]